MPVWCQPILTGAQNLFQSLPYKRHSAFEKHNEGKKGRSDKYGLNPPGGHKFGILYSENWMTGM